MSAREELPGAPPGAAPESRPDARPAPLPAREPGAASGAPPEPARTGPKRRAPKPAAVEPARPPPAPAGAPEISVIVPITTGDGRVREVVTALGAELERLGRTHEFVLVFDGVRGRAWAEAEELARERPGSVVALALEQPFGESLCLAAGLQRAAGRIVVTSPQYVQVDPYELGSLLAAIDAGADVVSPWRHPRVDPFLNRLQSAAFNRVMRRVLRAPLHDINCTFRALRREVLRDLPVHGDMYRFLPAIAARAGFKVAEVRVRHLQEWGGKGFFGPGVYMRRALDFLGVVFVSKFTLKPLRFFGTVGGVFLLLGALLCGAILVQGLVMSVPWFSRSLFLVGVLFFVLGVQVIGFGLVGEIIIYTRAKNVREYRVEKVWERRADEDRHDGTAPDGP